MYAIMGGCSVWDEMVAVWDYAYDFWGIFRNLHLISVSIRYSRS